MQIRLLLLGVVALSLTACSTGSSYRGNKKVTQGITYAHISGQEIGINPQGPNSSFADALLTDETENDGVGDDEDFTSENLTGSYGRYGDVVVTVSSRKFQLGDSPNGKMPLFMKAIETAYARALRTYRPSGFIYTMSSVGAVNPLSDVQVYCRMSERSANDNGQTACNLFFQTIRTEFSRLQGVRS